MMKTFVKLHIAAIGLVALLVSCTAGYYPTPTPTSPTATVTPTATAAADQLKVFRPRCTGSMEPFITCLDHALYRPYPAADAIRVGSVISFTSCKLRGVIHRVVQIREVAGKRYYQTKGDANDQADHCWVQYEDIDALIIRVERNMVPENAWLRDQVNAAHAAMLANPDADAAIATYHCWRRTALAAHSDLTAPQDCIRSTE